MRRPRLAPGRAAARRAAPGRPVSARRRARRNGTAANGRGRPLGAHGRCPAAGAAEAAAAPVVGLLHEMRQLACRAQGGGTGRRGEGGAHAG